MFHAEKRDFEINKVSNAQEYVLLYTLPQKFE